MTAYERALAADVATALNSPPIYIKPTPLTNGAEAGRAVALAGDFGVVGAPLASGGKGAAFAIENGA